jgi:hypothetical protein
MRDERKEMRERRKEVLCHLSSLLSLLSPSHTLSGEN